MDAPWGVISAQRRAYCKDIGQDCPCRDIKTTGLFALPVERLQRINFG
jgi:hypothetical protein